MPDNITITALHFTVTSVLLFRIKINKIQNQTNKYICVQRIYITLEVADFEVLTWADITQIEQEIFLSHSLSLDTKLLVTIYCVYFFLCVCAHDCRSKYFPYQFFFCYFWDILTIPFLYKSTKYFKFQSSVTDTLFSYFYDWNYLHMIWGRSTFILFKDIVIFYTYKIEWKLFQTKYHEPRFSHTAFPRCIFKFISNQCNL